nr:unnamed protein product [Callosobruchus chinensis]
MAEETTVHGKGGRNTDSRCYQQKGQLYDWIIVSQILRLSTAIFNLRRSGNTAKCERDVTSTCDCFLRVSFYRFINESAPSSSTVYQCIEEYRGHHHMRHVCV